MMWSKLKTRLGSAVVLVIVLLAIVFFAPPWAFSLAVCAVSFIVLREIIITFKHKTKKYLVITDYVFAILYMVTGFVNLGIGNYIMYMITVLFVMTLLTFSIVDNKEIAFQDVCASLFVVLYSVVFLLHLSLIRRMDYGICQVFLAFIGAWIPDTAAYFAGNFFGKHKLIESISPNKTVEGAVGAIVGSVVIFMLYGLLMLAFGFRVHFVALLVLSLLCGVGAQLGDLSASVMKRAYAAKDFGKLIPGHGGMLDRVDSLIFVTPIVYYFISIFPVLTK